MWENGYALLMEELTQWWEAAVKLLPNAVLAIVVMIAFGIGSIIVARIAKRMMQRASDSEAVTFLVVALARYSVLAFGVFVSLGIIGMQKTVASLLAGAGIVGLAIGFAFQDLAANFIAGVMMGFRKPFSVGDVIKTQDHLGTVHMVNLRNTILESFEGQRVIVPNKEVFQNPLINYSTTGHRRIDIAVGVAYDSDLEEVTKVALHAVSGLGFTEEGKDPQVLAQSFGGSSIDFEVRYWIPYPSGEVGYPEAKHRGVLAIKKAFDEHGIEIPFPIRPLDFTQTSDAPARLSLLNGSDGESEEEEQPARA